MNHNDDPSVSELLALAREGDAQMREQLFDACRSYLNLLARNQVEPWMQGKVDASDIVQQTLLEAYRDFEQFQGDSEGEWVAWLRCILERNATDFIRHYRSTAKRNIRREVALPHPSDDSSIHNGFEPSSPDATPSQQFLQSAEALRIVEALQDLSPDHRRVIELRNLQRLKFDEIAKLMERKRPAVQMLWMRAVEKLKRLVKD